MARKRAVPLTPIKDLTPEQAAKRRLARKLGLRNEDRFDRWVSRMQGLPESDLRHIRAGMSTDDFVQLNRIRRYESKFRTPAERLLEKKHILVDTANVNNHMSAFAFLERYLEQILALLQDPSVSRYRKKQLNEMLADLQRKIKYEGDLGIPRQFDLEGKYEGRDLGV